MQQIPRFEIHLDASVPHEKAIPSGVLNGLLDEFEARLRDEFGATVTIQMARTTRQSREPEGAAAALAGALSGGGEGAGHYM